jgi:hypothetical protein
MMDDSISVQPAGMWRSVVSAALTIWTVVLYESSMFAITGGGEGRRGVDAVDEDEDYGEEGKPYLICVCRAGGRREPS